MKSLKKIICIMLIAALLGGTAVLFTSCAADGFSQTAQSYFDALCRRDYESMYDMLTPQSSARLSLDSFKEYHDKVYNLLGVNKISIEQGETVASSDRIVYNYVLVLDTDEYGQFRYDSTLEVLKKLDDFYLIEWSPSNVITPMTWDDRIYKTTLRAKRGEIFDCNGKVLVKNAYAVTVYADLTKVEDIPQAAAGAAQALELDAQSLESKMQSAKDSEQDTAVLATYIPGELTVEAEEALNLIEGIKIDRDSMTPIRYAVYGSAAAHTIGYSTPVTAEDREQEEYASLLNGTRVGRTGVERQYDSVLQGTNGTEIYLLSADSRTRTSLYKKEAVNGLDISLTIDIDIQLAAEEAMAENYTDRATGTTVVNDPKTGEIKAMVSYPSFDLNIYATDSPRSDAADLVTDESLPLFNRLTQGLYAPGSVFKSMTAIMGLETGTVTLDTAFPYEDEIISMGNGTDGWKPKGSSWVTYVIRQHYANSASLGKLSMKRAIAYSDNIYFGWLGMQLGAETFLEWADKLGFKEAAPFDLPLQSASIANDDDNLRNDAKLLADTAFGQGELLVTPVQLAAAFSIYGNEGSIMAPYVINYIADTDSEGKHQIVSQTQPNTWIANAASTRTINDLLEILEFTVDSATGRGGYVRGMRIAGKTGTAQTGNDVTEIGWYAGYIIEGGENYVVLVHTDGFKGETSDIKHATIKAVFNYLKD